MTKTEMENLVNRAFAVMERAFPRITHAYDAALASERRHRKGEFRRYHPRAGSATTAAKLFAVKFVAQYACDPERMPGLADYFRIRTDALIAAALVAAHGVHVVRSTLREAGLDPHTLAALDYCELVGQARVPS